MFVKHFEKISGEKLPKKFNHLTINIDYFGDTALALFLNGAKIDYMRKDEIVLPVLTKQEKFEMFDKKYFSQIFSKNLAKILLHSTTENKKVVRKILAEYFSIRGEIEQNPYDTFTPDSVLEEDQVIQFSLLMKKRIPYLLFLSVTKQKYDINDISILKENLKKYGYEDIENDMLKLIKIVS